MKNIRPVLTMEQLLEAVVKYKCAARDGLVSFFGWKQLIWDLFYGRGMAEKVELTGSFFEALPAEVCGDQDVMRVNITYPIIMFSNGLETSRETTPSAVTLGAIFDQLFPVYACLVVPNIDCFRLEELFPGSVVNGGTSSYFSAAFFVHHTCGPEEEIHGPASVQLALPGSPEQGSRDVVSCLFCPEWPPIAGPFLHRYRSTEWPSASLLQRIKQQGCHMVPIGHPASLNAHLQWRLSFSVAEKLLLHDVDTNGIACMVILKVLKKCLWPTGNAAANGICSYFLKTACLWIYENTSLAGLTHIHETTLRILDFLIQCYRERKLPHYFVPEHNLIEHISISTCAVVVGQLQQIRSKVSIIVLCNLECDERIAKVFSHISNLSPEVVYCKYASNAVECILEAVEKQHNGTTILKAGAEMLQIGSKFYFIQERIKLRFILTPDISTLFEIKHFFNMLENLLKPMGENGHAFIQSLLQTIEEKQRDIVRGNYHACFRTLLYRGTAHTFLLLYRYARDMKQGLDLAQLYYTSAVHCLTEGIIEWYPDGTNDGGLSGHVTMAKFYYLNKEWGKLSDTLQQLKPLMANILAKPEFIDCAIPFTVYKENTHFDVLWKSDLLFNTHFSKSFHSNVIRFHPISLALYFEAHWLNQLQKKDKYEDCISQLEQIYTLLNDKDFKDSTKWILYVLSNPPLVKSAL